ncbi:hypothetical protein GGI20_006377, partial [Coemansia sp. BCRC 34301]
MRLILGHTLSNSIVSDAFLALALRKEFKKTRRHNMATAVTQDKTHLTPKYIKTFGSNRRVKAPTVASRMKKA